MGEEQWEVVYVLWHGRCARGAMSKWYLKDHAVRAARMRYANKTDAYSDVVVRHGPSNTILFSAWRDAAQKVSNAGRNCRPRQFEG